MARSIEISCYTETNLLPQGIRFAKYEAVTLACELESETATISGWTFSLYIRRIGSTLLLQKAGSISSEGNGQFAFSLTTSETGGLTVGTWDYEIWRTNSGNETRLAKGPVIVEPQAWQ